MKKITITAWVVQNDTSLAEASIDEIVDDVWLHLGECDQFTFCSSEAAAIDTEHDLNS